MKKYQEFKETINEAKDLKSLFMSDQAKLKSHIQGMKDIINDKQIISIMTKAGVPKETVEKYLK